jgi:hypothetical protein
VRGREEIASALESSARSELALFGRAVRGGVVAAGHQQHAADDVRGGDAFGARNGAVLAQALRSLVHVLAVDNARVVSVHHVVDLVLLDHVLQVLLVHDVGHTGHDLVDELAA